MHLVGRSFKYHRPRGVLSAGSEEPNALVTVDRGGGRMTPNLRATQIELYEGLTATSQNRFPSLGFDLGAAVGFAGPLLSAGFYYKTFLWPPSFWKRVYEPAIRAAAGLGRAPAAADPDRYVHQYTHCEVLVVGAGPAGIAAALEAADTGVRVMLCDEQAELGGSWLSEPDTAGLKAALDRLEGRVTLLPRTTAFGWYPDNLIGLAERVTDHQASPDPRQPRERLWQVRAREVVLATGAIERPLVFPHNDLPGIMLADAARVYANRWGVAVGRSVAMATNNDSAYRAALDLHRGGVTIAAVLDQRVAPEGELVQAVLAAGIPVRTGVRIAGTTGGQRIKAVQLADGQGALPCDALLMSGGWTPSVHLFSQARGTLRFDAGCGAFVPDKTTAAVRAVGACAGDVPAAEPVAPTPHPRAFVDFQNDVTTKDFSVATQEGFRSIEHTKRYTTAGMATDQGKTSNINALATAAALQNRPMAEIGLTTYRPPYTPVTFGTLAGTGRGALFDPVRHAPLHDWAAEQGAVFEDAGSWKRARYFPRPGETMRDAVARECLAVRTRCGILDASTLGKIEVTGPDAAEFLNRMYLKDLSSLSVGRCRYAVLLGEDGFVRDDGIVARLAEDRFHVTTTTSGAAGVLHLMEDYLQTEFPELRAWLTSTTEHWATIAVQGPCSRAVLAGLVEGVDLAEMPHMSVRACRVAGVLARLFRVSFTGETGFEIAVPAHRATAVWDALMATGGATPYGTEAMHVLRAEKGFFMIGQETDGTVIPADLGLPSGARKRDFVGKRSLVRPDMLREDRRQLVGLLADDPAVLLEEGAQIVGDTGLGHVTSSYWSATLGRSIALALVADGRGRTGECLSVPMPGGAIRVTVVAPVFYDPDGARLDVHEAFPATSSGSGLTRPSLSKGPETVGSGPTMTLWTTPTTRLNIRSTPAATTQIGLALSVLLGSVPNRAVRGRDRAALWLGPDEWLVIAPESDTALAERAMAAAKDASVVDVSDRFVGIEIAGPRAAWCLNGFCALDLAPHMFPVGMCTRTLFGKAEIVLWRTATDTFHLEVGRSFAPYVWRCLEEAG